MYFCVCGSTERRALSCRLQHHITTHHHVDQNEGHAAPIEEKLFISFGVGVGGVLC